MIKQCISFALWGYYYVWSYWDYLRPTFAKFFNGFFGRRPPSVVYAQQKLRHWGTRTLWLVHGSNVITQVYNTRLVKRSCLGWKSGDCSWDPLWLGDDVDPSSLFGPFPRLRGWTATAHDTTLRTYTAICTREEFVPPPRVCFESLKVWSSMRFWGSENLSLIPRPSGRNYTTSVVDTSLGRFPAQLGSATTGICFSALQNPGTAPRG